MGSRPYRVLGIGRQALPTDQVSVPLRVATDLIRKGPWYIEMIIGPKEARRLGSNGRMVDLDAPDITFGPFKLTFKKNGAAILEEVTDYSANMCFGNAASWYLGPLDNEELSETGLPPGSAFLEMRFVCQEQFSIPGDQPWEWKTYIPQGEILVANTYIQHEGGNIRKMGAFALTMLESEFFTETYKIVGCISRFSNTLVLAGDDEDDIVTDPNNDPEFQDTILAIEQSLRDASGGGSKQAQQQLLRQLILQWHPDRQLENPELGSKVFRWLQSARKKLGRSGR